MFNQFLERFGERELACLTADRELLGKDWFGYLRQEARPPFRIRIRHNHILGKGRQRLKASTFFQALQPGQQQVFRHKRRLWGHWLYIAALRLEDGTLLVIATQSAPKSAITDYAKRWGIETLFGIFKSQGFCLESTHLSDGERLNKLLALLSLALGWIFLSWEWLHQLKPLVVKKHGRRAESLFRYSFDYLRHMVLNLEQKGDQFSRALKFLSCT